jgi:hypothetical protein
MKLPGSASFLATWAAVTVMVGESLLAARHGSTIAALGAAVAPALSTAGAAPPPPAAAARDPRYLASMWVAYAAADARAHGGMLNGACSDQVGERFLQKWAGAKHVRCADGGDGGGGGGGDRDGHAVAGEAGGGGGGERSAAGGPNAPGGLGPTSRVECYAYPNQGYGLACLSANLLLNASAFMGPPAPPGSAEHRAYLPAGGAGSVRLACRPPSMLPADGGAPPAGAGSGAPAPSQALTVDELVRDALAKDEARWFKPPAFQQASPGEVAARCADGAGGSGVVPHPVMFVSRLDTTNPFWWTQSLLQAFMTLAVLDTAAANATGGSPPPFARELQVRGLAVLPCQQPCAAVCSAACSQRGTLDGGSGSAGSPACVPRACLRRSFLRTRARVLTHAHTQHTTQTR